MKKITSLLCAIILASSSVFAGGNWATSAVSVTKDGGSAYNYKLNDEGWTDGCLLYTSPSPRDGLLSRMPSSA